MAPKISLADLPPDVQEKVKAQHGKRIVKPRSFTAEDERRNALRVCALIADLSQAERNRVLRRALKVNEA